MDLGGNQTAAMQAAAVGEPDAYSDFQDSKGEKAKISSRSPHRRVRQLSGQYAS
jgi:hypothetical protein